MSSDPDACIPAPLRDFVFDLHDSVRRSHIQSEQAIHYNVTFRELSAKYFDKSPWPSPESISSECESDELFLAFYRELTHRHFHSVGRPQARDRIDGWKVYQRLFDLILEEASAGSTDGKGLYILPEWAFDILHEFVYQFQGFCQFRTQTAANVANAASGHKYNKTPNLDTIKLLSDNRGAWAVETVLFYLHRLSSLSEANDRPMGSTAAYRHLSFFASVVLSRLECLLGDYHASLAALSPVFSSPANLELLNTVFQAKLSLAYHAGVSYLMLRRYKDATRVLGDICANMQRLFKTGMLRKLPGATDQFQKLYDRMIALLAIVTHICPAPKLDEGIVRNVREKHGNQLLKIESGEEGYEDLFIFACPKFITPSVPDYNVLTTDTAEMPSNTTTTHGGQEAYRLQVKRFVSEMSQQRTLRKLRSYMKLYTSIKVDKLAAFNDAKEDEFLARMLCYKHKMKQLEVLNEEGDPLTGKMGTALDIHYYITGDMVHVGDEEKVRRFETFFVNGIKANDDIMRDLDVVSVDI